MIQFFSWNYRQDELTMQGLDDAQCVNQLEGAVGLGGVKNLLGRKTAGLGKA